MESRAEKHFKRSKINCIYAMLGRSLFNYIFKSFSSGNAHIFPNAIQSML